MIADLKTDDFLLCLEDSEHDKTLGLSEYYSCTKIMPTHQLPSASTLTLVNQS